jgi:hypothetical protein
MGENLAIGYAPTEHKNGRYWERITVGFGLDTAYLPKLLSYLSHAMVAYKATQERGVHELLANGALDRPTRCGCGKCGFCESSNII